MANGTTKFDPVCVCGAGCRSDNNKKKESDDSRTQPTTLSRRVRSVNSTKSISSIGSSRWWSSHFEPNRENERTNESTNNQSKDANKARTKEEASKASEVGGYSSRPEGTNEGTNKQRKERRNEQTKEQTNKRKRFRRRSFIVFRLISCNILLSKNKKKIIVFVRSCVRSFVAALFVID